LHELPDLFCEIYDAIDLASFRTNAEQWLNDSRLESLAMTVKADALAGTLASWSVRERIRHSADSEAHAFAMLSGLDGAFVAINPAMPTGTGTDAPGLAALHAQVIATGRYDSGNHGLGGALIPRVVYRDGGQLPDHPREAFSAVLRVEAAHWDACDFRAVPLESHLSRREVSTGLRVGCSPLIADPNEMRFEVVERSDRRFYRIGASNAKATVERVPRLLDAMVAAELQLGIVPELTLTPELLEAWKEALAERRGKLAPLRWLLVGSGHMADGARADNTAVLLDARSSREIAAQPKVFPFNFDRSRLELWKLTNRLGEEPIDEDLAPGDRTVIVDAGYLRLAMVVCEDLGRVVDLAPPLRSFGVSHLIAPVFSRPTKDRRWERTAADIHAQATGSTVIVANSRVMHEITGTEGGTGLVVWPASGAVLEADQAESLACFTLQRDGGAVLD
jgi:predicted amidohydrolase